MQAQTQTQAPTPAHEESSALFLQSEMQDIIKNDRAFFDSMTTLIADALVRGWRKRAGAQRIYIPAEPRNESRDANIKREFNGTNREEICRKYSISRARLYQIINKRACE